MPFFGNALRLLEDLETRRKELHQAAREDCLCVSLCEQKLWHFRGGQLWADYPVSTSRAAPSCVPDSLGTPTGLHQIAERIGAGAVAGTVFKGRQALGFTWENAPEELRGQNLITSRILWLDGLETGKNRGDGCDTHGRYIYIHGTNQEEKIGTPNSHGCVLLRNADVIALFDSVPSGAFVWIG
ncbi:MAG: L,D-transpeptidase [Puniceicoccales bacterium]|jgi:hypothetical protein|nr:L,D-transpeptidase [Puniceicoccales bacterium]